MAMMVRQFQPACSSGAQIHGITTPPVLVAVSTMPMAAPWWSVQSREMMTFIAATIDDAEKPSSAPATVVHGQVGGKQEHRHGDAAGGRADQYRESPAESIDDDAHAERRGRADHELRGRQQVDFRVRPAELLHRRAVHER